MRTIWLVYEDGRMSNNTYYDLRKELQATGWEFSSGGFRRGELEMKFLTLAEYDEKTGGRVAKYAGELLLKKCVDQAALDKSEADYRSVRDDQRMARIRELESQISALKKGSIHKSEAADDENEIIESAEED